MRKKCFRIMLMITDPLFIACLHVCLLYFVTPTSKMLDILGPLSLDQRHCAICCFGNCRFPIKNDKFTAQVSAYILRLSWKNITLDVVQLPHGRPAPAVTCLSRNTSHSFLHCPAICPLWKTHLVLLV